VQRGEQERDLEAAAVEGRERLLRGLRRLDAIGEEGIVVVGEAQQRGGPLAPVGRQRGLQRRPRRR
jgi:hypothetical protein